MEDDSHALKAGLFLLGLFAAGIALVIWLRGDYVQQETMMVVADFPVRGLQREASVRYRGIEVGKVRSLKISASDPRRLEIMIQVISGTPMPYGTTAELSYQGLTGLASLELKLPKAGAEAAATPKPAADSADKPLSFIPVGSSGYPEIKLMPGLLEKLSEGGEQLQADVTTIVANLKRLLNDQNLDRFSAGLAALEASAETLQSGLKDAPNLVENLNRMTGARTQAELAALLQASSRASAAIEGLARSSQGFVERNDQRLSTLAGQLDGLSREGQGVLQEVRPVLASLKRLADESELAAKSLKQTSGSAERELLPRVNQLTEALGQASRELTALARRLESDPQALIYGAGREPRGPGE